MSATYKTACRNVSSAPVTFRSLCAVATGVSIVATTSFSKRSSNAQLPTSLVLAVRFYLLLLVSLIPLTASHTSSSMASNMLGISISAVTLLVTLGIVARNRSLR